MTPGRQDQLNRPRRRAVARRVDAEEIRHNAGHYSNMPSATVRQPYSMRPIAQVVVGSMLVMAVLQAMPETFRVALRYDRTGIGAGEYWRILSGHFVHLSWRHLVLNLTGLGLGAWLFGPDRSPLQWLLATLVSALACGLGLWWFSPDVGWCVGLSGVLHGLMIVGFGGWIIGGDRRAWAFLGVVLAKLWWEQAGGDMPWANTMAGGRVVTDAHLWGAAGGALFLGVEAAWRHFRAWV